MSGHVQSPSVPGHFVREPQVDASFDPRSFSAQYGSLIRAPDGARLLIRYSTMTTPKNKRANFQPVIASSGPASGRSPWMKRAIRFSIHSGRPSRDERLHYFSYSV